MPYLIPRAAVDRYTAEHDMVVLAFLRAEVDSPRWREGCIWVLQQLGATRDHIDRPDLTREPDNSL